MKITVLAGGVGAARFLEGLVKVTDPKDITVIVNTGDDEEFYGLYVCPDIDTIIYTLSGNNNKKQGWGVKNDTYTTLSQLKKLGIDTWFTLGDKDIATHLLRTSLLQSGKTKTEVTKQLVERYNIPIALLPMTNDKITTMVHTRKGVFPFQEYFVKRKCKDQVVDVWFKGIAQATPSDEVKEAIAGADCIIVAPSNPIVSIGAILAVPTMRELLFQAKAKKIAISPIIAGKTIKGPADKMLSGLGFEPSAIGVAKLYQDFIDVLIIDKKDSVLKKEIERFAIKVVITNTIMKTLLSKKALAETVLHAI